MEREAEHDTLWTLARIAAGIEAVAERLNDLLWLIEEHHGDHDGDGGDGDDEPQPFPNDPWLVGAGWGAPPGVN